MENYDFELLVSSEEFKKNQLKMRKEIKPKKKVLPVIATIIFIVITIVSTIQLFTIETKKTTPVGDYTCRGGIVEMCFGSKEVKDYLGV